MTTLLMTTPTRNKPKAREFFVKVSFAQRFGPRVALKFLSKYAGCELHSYAEVIETFSEDFFERILSSEAHELVRLTPSLGQNLFAALNDHTTYEQLEDEAYKNNVTLVSLADDGYPILLRQIHAPPFFLYVAGTIPQATPSLAVVGSRNAGVYSRDVLDNLIPSLVDASVVIVSGGAYGVDALAHSITVAHKGKTVVVLGSGILNPYPREHKKLFDSVVANGGAVVSAFPLNAFPDRKNFPERNRIIAGMSQGTLVVQAAQESGALITAQFALDEGRSVMAIPGRITDPLSAGCHKLIAAGARLVTTANDVYHELGLVQNENLNPYYSKEQNPLLKLLDDPTTIDELITTTGTSLGELQEVLFDLQLEGKTVQTSPGVWRRC